jgi:hypothetical protein
MLGKFYGPNFYFYFVNRNKFQFNEITNAKIKVNFLLSIDFFFSSSFVNSRSKFFGEFYRSTNLLVLKLSLE